MNILLINPPAENEITGNNPGIIEEERGYNPPLGLLYVAAYLEKHTQHRVEVLDAVVERIGYNRLKDIIIKRRPDVVGITCTTFMLVDVIKTARIVKSVNREIKVVLGGPHVYIYPEETIRISVVDYLVLGEGELVFTELVESIGDVNKLKDIKGLVFKDNGIVVNTGSRPLIDNLDKLPFPARHLTPYKRYTSLLAKRFPVATMVTSRGCPYRCTFCARPHLGKIFRPRSANNIVDEMEKCINMGISELLFYDDTFSVHRQRVIDICAEIVKRKIDISWDIRARIDNMDEEMLYSLKKAGCRRIHYGVEAGTDKILRVLNKGIALEQVTRIFEMTKKAKISTLAYFMIGSPGETREDILRTIEFAKRLPADYLHITILTPFPATAIYREALERGILKRDFWREFALNPDKDFRPAYWEEVLSREELLELLTYAYKSFYLRPGYIIKELMKTRSFAEFSRKAKAGFKVFGLRAG